MSDSGNIGTLVRHWLHCDKLASTFYKQAHRNTSLKNEYETQIVHALKQRGMINAIIQTGTGTLNVIEEKNPKSLTLIKIEELLNSYFTIRGGKNETRDIMNFIKGNRGYDIKLRLKNNQVGGVKPPALPPMQ
jgi:hypothetical protein